MNPVIHFEMPYDDPGRLSKFYQAVFGWKMVNMGEQMGGYVLGTTIASDSNGTAPLSPGRSTAAFSRRSRSIPR
jgi:predicted enzyme related to lactoylglutathione lyase